MDLSWPMRWTDPPGDRYMTKNGTFLSPNYLDSCLNQPVPSNVSRQLFPAQNGYPIFDLVNQDNSVYNIGVDMSVNHLWYEYGDLESYNTGVQSTYKSAFAQRSWAAQRKYVNGSKCYLPLDMTKWVVDKDGNSLTASDLVGLNVTIAVNIWVGRNYTTLDVVDEASSLFPMLFEVSANESSAHM
jgi:hypothetical protein